jgi:soluble lytic murein transglycosylase
MEKTRNRPKERKPKSKRSRLSGMQIAVIVLAALVMLTIAAFGTVLIVERVRYERDLRNYPVAYTEWIFQYADEYELDPYLVQAIMRCESSNDPTEVSGAGAIGLMQIMPDTGTWIAHKLGLDDTYTQEQLSDPETSIRFGCWYINFLSGRFDGRIMEIVAAYNAGHGSVEDWLSDSRFSADGKLTSIPFEQTARYYEKVMTAYEKYKTLYPDQFSGAADVPSEP